MTKHELKMLLRMACRENARLHEDVCMSNEAAEECAQKMNYKDIYIAELKKQAAELRSWREDVTQEICGTSHDRRVEDVVRSAKEKYGGTHEHGN